MNKVTDETSLVGTLRSLQELARVTAGRIRQLKLALGLFVTGTLILVFLGPRASWVIVLGLCVGMGMCGVVAWELGQQARIRKLVKEQLEVVRRWVFDSVSRIPPGDPQTLLTFDELEDDKKLETAILRLETYYGSFN